MRRMPLAERRRYVAQPRRLRDPSYMWFSEKGFTDIKVYDYKRASVPGTRPPWVYDNDGETGDTRRRATPGYVDKLGYDRAGRIKL